MRKDHSGITFVELIIAIAISTIIFGAAILFLGMAHKIITMHPHRLIYSRSHRF